MPDETTAPKKPETKAKKPTLDELCQQVDAIADAKERKAFFMAHPELEARFSHANFI